MEGICVVTCGMVELMEHSHRHRRRRHRCCAMSTDLLVFFFSSSEINAFQFIFFWCRIRRMKIDHCSSLASLALSFTCAYFMWLWVIHILWPRMNEEHFISDFDEKSEYSNQWLAIMINITVTDQLKRIVRFNDPFIKARVHSYSHTNCYAMQIRSHQTLNAFAWFIAFFRFVLFVLFVWPLYFVLCLVYLVCSFLSFSCRFILLLLLFLLRVSLLLLYRCGMYVSVCIIVDLYLCISLLIGYDFVVFDTTIYMVRLWIQDV